MNDKSGSGSSSANPATPMRTTMLLVSFVLFTAIYVVIVNTLDRIGLGEGGQTLLIIAIPLTILLISAYITRTLGPASLGPDHLGHGGGLYLFQNAGSNVGAVHNGLAGAGEWYSVYFVIGLLAAFTSTDHDGLAIVIGVFSGFALAAVLIAPKLPAHRPASLTGAIMTPFAANSQNGGVYQSLLRWAIAAIIILCAMAFLVAQISVGSQILQLKFELTSFWAAFLLLVPVLILLLAGGMRGQTAAGMLLFFVIGAAVLLPVLWLSLSITGNPIAQFSFGTQALQPILQLEEQLLQNTQANPDQLATAFETGNFDQLSGFADFLTTAFVMMAGTAAMPLLYTRMACTNSTVAATRSVGWTLIFVALLVSTIPAFATFLKFEIYRDLVGLPINQLGEGLDWLVQWAEIDNGRYALVCGSPPIDLEAIITACGNDPQRVLTPSDLQINPLAMVLGIGDIAQMPSVYSAISYAGVLSACITTAGISMMVIVNTINNELFFPNRLNSQYSTPDDTAPTAPIARRLFVLRLSLIVVSFLAIWLATGIPLPKSDLSLWAFSLAAGTLFPVLILAIWWRPITLFGALAGLLSGLAVILLFLPAIEFGPDWIAQNGDEARLFLFGQTLKSENAGILAFPVAIAMTMLVSALQFLISKWRSKD